MSYVPGKLRIKRPRTSSNTEMPKKKVELIQGVQKTKAQVQFEKHQTKTGSQKLRKKIKATYKDEIEGYNKKLSEMAEQFDIPRVGPG